MTILKLGFAMGGGVSLGTFNAGALSQSIKLAIVYGKDKNGELFDSVEIDVFSGASAGSISLALMLRALAAQTPSQIQQANIDLATEFSEDVLNALPANKKDALIAAQVMQNVQHNIWVKQVNMENLLSKGQDNDLAGTSSLKHTAGILNRGALETIAVNLIKDSPTINLDKSKALLGERVLFASSLTNLTPIIQDAKSEFKVGLGGDFALQDGMTSYTHKESRVFDLYLGEKNGKTLRDSEKHPDRWVRYHLGSRQTGTIGDMSDDNHDVWWRIVSTAMASGAFPMAFEPIVLERFNFEFADTWPRELQHQAKFNFTYIDGGVFNNEPIRDAFKLASFMDANDERLNIERSIIFVDPSIASNQSTFNLPVHPRYALTSPLFGDNPIGDIDGVDLVRKASLDKLQGHLGSIVSCIFNQARSIEGDKIFKVRKKFKNRNEIRKSYYLEAPIDVSNELLKALLSQITHLQESDDKLSLFPNTGLNVLAEVKRIAREEPQLFSGLDYERIESDLNNILQHQSPSYSSYSWYLALRFIMLDQSMSLTGKSDKTRFFAIGPCIDFADPTKPELIKLPGDKLQAFGGFFYEPTRNIDLQLGKYCAHQALSTEDFLDIPPLPKPAPELSESQVRLYDKALHKGTNQLIDRVLNMVSDSHIPFISSIPKFALKLLVNKVLSGDSLASKVELRIKIPQGLSLELDGRGRLPIIGDKDIHPVQFSGESYLITTAEFKDSKWVGEHITRGNSIIIDKNNRKFAKIPLPSQPQMQIIHQQLSVHGYAYLVYDFSGKRTDHDWQVEAPLMPMHSVLSQQA